MNLIKESINKKNIIFFLTLLIPIFYIAGSLLINLITIFFILLVIIFREKKSFIDIYYKYKIQIILIFLFAFINIIISETQFYSSKKFILYLRFFLFTICYIYLLSQLSDDKIKIIIKFYLIVVLFVIVDSLVQLVFGKDFFGHDYFFAYNRITGPFGDEMIVGFFVLNFGILTLSLASYFKLINHKLISLIIVCLLIFILLTGERTSFLTGLYFLFILFFLSNKKKYVFYSSAISIIFSLLLIYNFEFLKNKYPVYEILQNSIDVKKNVLVSNYEPNINKTDINKFIPVHKWQGHFERSIEIFKKNIVFGSGFRSYRIVCFEYQKKYFKSENISKCSTHPHNFHLEILSDNGILGYLIFLIFIFYLCKNFFIERYYNNFGISLLFCLILSFIIPLKTTGSVFTTNYAFVFWFLISNYLYLIKKYKN